MLEIADVWKDYCKWRTLDPKAPTRTHLKEFIHMMTLAQVEQNLVVSMLKKSDFPSSSRQIGRRLLQACSEEDDHGSCTVPLTTRRETLWEEYSRWCIDKVEIYSFSSDTSNLMEYSRELFVQAQQIEMSRSATVIDANYSRYTGSQAKESVLRSKNCIVKIKEELTEAYKLMTFYPERFYQKDLDKNLLAMEVVVANIPSLDATDISSDLISSLTPDHRYWKFTQQKSPAEFWKDPLVAQLLGRVFNRQINILQYAISLGVTPEMVLSNLKDIPVDLHRYQGRCDRGLQRELDQLGAADSTPLTKRLRKRPARTSYKQDSSDEASSGDERISRDDDTSDDEYSEDSDEEVEPLLDYKTFRKTIKKEADFWSHEIVQEVLKKFGEKEITAAKAGDQLGLKEEVFQAKLKKFKTSERENKRQKMSLMEQQLDREEERMEDDDSEDEVSEYDKKRMENMRMKLEIFNQLKFDLSKNKLAVPKAERKPTEKKIIIPRARSARIKVIQEMKEVEEKESEDVTAVDPLELSSFAVPPVALRIDEVLSITADQDAGKKVVSTAKVALEKDSQDERFDLENLRVGEVIKGIVPGSLISSTISEGPSNLLVFGDDQGYVALINGSEDSLPWTQFRPHSGPVSSVQWVRGSSGILSSAGSDGYVRIWDFNAESLNLGYSWFQHKSISAPRAIVSHTWLTPDLLILSTDKIGIQVLDKRVGKQVETISDVLFTRLTRFSDSEFVSVGHKDVGFTDLRRMDKSVVKTFDKQIISASLNDQRKLLVANFRDICVYAPEFLFEDETSGNPSSSIVRFSVDSSAYLKSYNNVPYHLHTGAVWVPGTQDTVMFETLSKCAKKIEPKKNVSNANLNIYSPVLLTLKVEEDERFSWVSTVEDYVDARTNKTFAINKGFGGVGNGSEEGSVSILRDFKNSQDN